MQNEFSRTEMLIGKEALTVLSKSRVGVFGIGGVGTFVVEALARSGVGHFAIVDSDVVCVTNINRQLIASQKTIGHAKVDVMKERILEINPKAQVDTYKCFFTEENAAQFPFSDFDYVVDAIDTVSSKLTLVEKAKEHNLPIISCMGAGNKLDPTKFEIADIFSTSVCPLAKVMRKELRQRGIDGLKVVFSRETPIKPDVKEEVIEETGKRQVPGSVSFVPSVAGLIIAGEVIKDLIR